MNVHLKFFEISFFFFFQSKMVSTTNGSCMLGTIWVYDMAFFFLQKIWNKHVWIFSFCIQNDFSFMYSYEYFWVLMALIQFSIKIILTPVGWDPVNIKGFVSGPLWVIHPSSATAPSGSGDTTVKEVRPYIFVQHLVFEHLFKFCLKLKLRLTKKHLPVYKWLNIVFAQ